MIKEFLEREWQMFQLVNNEGGRAACQDDRRTFDGMRSGQFLSWPDEVLAAYLRDLQDAERDGRNLVAEKYARMMESTAPLRYQEIRDAPPQLSARAAQLASEISSRLAEQEAICREQYPLVAGAGRPVRSSEDGPYQTSLETYMRSELCTYSEDTLERLKAYMDRLDAEGKLLGRIMLENTVKYYGYASLEQAEASLMGSGTSAE